MSKTILLADDSVTIQKVVELTFMDQDYQVLAVSDGQAAIDKLGELRPDLVIADVHMPEANGYEVCRQAKQTYPGIPVLLLVGTFEPFDQQQANTAGADSHLKKPFDSQDLLRQVDTLISESGGAEAAAPAALPEPAPVAPPAPEPAAPAPAPAPPVPAAAPAPAPMAPAPAPMAPAPAPAAPAPAPIAPAPMAPAPAPAAPAAAPMAPAPVSPLETVQVEPDGGPPPVEPIVPFEQVEPMMPPLAAAAPSLLDDGPQAVEPIVPHESIEPIMAEPAPMAPAPAVESPVFDIPAEPAAAPEPMFEMEAPAQPAPAPAAEAASVFDIPAEPAVPVPEPAPEPAAAAPEPVFETPAEPIETFEQPPPPAPLVESPPVEEPEPSVAAPAMAAPEAAAPEAAAAPAPVSTGNGLSDEDVDRIARRVVDLLGDSVLRQVAWEVVPDLAEVVIKERIRELESQVE